jgi:phage pi2 protein 07
MIIDRQLQMLRDIQQVTNTPEWMKEAEAQEQGWVTDDEDTAEQWWNSQHTDCDVPF